MTDERCILIPVCGEGKDLVYAKMGGLMSWGREKNEGSKYGDGGCGPYSPCSDPSPDCFNKHTGE